MSEVVLDASALLALLQEEPGSKVIEDCIDDAVMSTVNLSEVLAQLIKHKMPGETALEIVASLGLHIVPFDEQMAYQAATLITTTHKSGLSLGDRACLALSQILKLPVITTDRAWSKLNLNCEIRIAR